MDNFASIIMFIWMIAICMSFAFKAKKYQRTNSTKFPAMILIIGFLFGFCVSVCLELINEKIHYFKFERKDTAIGVFYLQTLLLSVVGTLSAVCAFGWWTNKKNAESDKVS